MRWPILLALDPSMTAFGWAAVALTPDGPVLLAAGVIETKPTSEKQRKKLGMTVAEDDARRARFIRRELASLMHAHAPTIVAIESGFGSQGAKAAKLLGAAQAVAACAVDTHLAVGRAIYVTVHEAGDAIGIQRTQRAVGGRDAKARAESSKTRKAAIARAVIARFGVLQWMRALGITGTTDEGDLAMRAKRYEGAFDAAAVAIAAWERPEVAAVRAMAAQHDNGLGAPPGLPVFYGTPES